MKPVLDFIVNILKNEKKKLFVAFASFILFMIFCFPYGDLADVVTVWTSKATGNQVYLQFDDMGIGILKLKDEFQYKIMPELKEMNYKHFLEYYKKFPLINSEDALDFISRG